MKRKSTEWVRKATLGSTILKFKIENLSKAEACKYVQAVGDYNEFNPSKVCRAISASPAGTTFTVGREYSPVIYAKGDVAAVKKAFAQTGPDESDVQKNGALRMWWG